MSEFKDFLWKIKIFFKLGAYASTNNYRLWIEDVWARDPDSRYCCNGHQCGCYGSTVREVYDHGHD